MNWKNRLSGLFALLILASSTIYGKCLPFEKVVFNSGEKLTYKVFYNLGAAWVGAGQAVFTTRLKKYSGKSVYHIVGTGRTYNSYDWIFKVRDRYETYVDANRLIPLKFIRSVREGGYKLDRTVLFNHAKSRAYSGQKAYKVKACTQDVLSTIYFARNIDYSKYRKGAKIPFTLFLDNELHTIYIRYLGKCKIRTKYGYYNAIKIKPLLIKGTIFKGGEQMTVYVSDDDNHIPLRIESPILVGSVKVDLRAARNLKYPFTAKIK